MQSNAIGKKLKWGGFFDAPLYFGVSEGDRPFDQGQSILFFVRLLFIYLLIHSNDDKSTGIIHPSLQLHLQTERKTPCSTCQT